MSYRLVGPRSDAFFERSHEDTRSRLCEWNRGEVKQCRSEIRAIPGFEGGRRSAAEVGRPLYSRRSTPYPFEVTKRRRGSFPIGAARDLLGVVRGLYAARLHEKAGRVTLARIQAAGALLDEAIRLAQTGQKADEEAAWEKAEEATRRVCALVDCVTAAEPIVKAAALRVSGERVALRRKPDER